MATREDVAFDLTRSPRIAEVKAPSIEMVMQDYVDTVRPFESSFEAMSHPFLISASGKEDLGGGALVALTIAEQDLKLAFEGRTAAAQVGAVTTGSSAPIRGEVRFFDSAATFITNNVQRGSLVINFTDQSVADVVEVVSETELVTKVPVNGIGNTFDVTDIYHVFNIVQVSTTGGNITAKDVNNSTFPAILPTAFTQVIQTTASSGTIQELEDIQFGAFGGGVTINQSKTTTGTVFPAGTLRSPVNNLSDAMTIADERGFDTFYVFGDTFVFSPTDTIDGFIFEGRSAAKTTIILTEAATITNCIFRKATVTGGLDGGNDISDCIIGSLNYLDGTLIDSLIAGTVTLNGTQANIIRCGSGVAGGGLNQAPTINMGGSGTDLIIRDWHGSVKLDNLTAVGDNISIDMSSGRVIIDSTVTAGLIYVRGIATIDDSGTAAIDTSGLLNQTNIAKATWDALISNHSVPGSFGHFIVRRLLTVAKFFSLRI